MRSELNPSNEGIAKSDCADYNFINEFTFYLVPLKLDDLELILSRYFKKMIGWVDVWSAEEYEKHHKPPKAQTAFFAGDRDLSAIDSDARVCPKRSRRSRSTSER